jgi:hypothetical protein
LYRAELDHMAHHGSGGFKYSNAYKTWEAELKLMEVRAAYHGRLARDYREAAEHPWLTVDESIRTPAERNAARLTAPPSRPRITGLPMVVI